jgi:hypothetical protein
MAKKYGITIGEGIEAKALANPGTAGNYVRLIPFIQASNISLDDDMSVLNSKKGYDALLDIVRNHPELSLDKTGKIRSEANVGGFAVDFMALINFNKPSGVGGNYFKDEEQRLNQAKQGNKGFNRAAARTAANLSFPPQEQLHRIIERALQKVDDPDTKSWFTVKLLTGLRDPDITQIELEPEDMSLRKDGVKYLSRSDKRVIIFNKGNRVPFDLGDVVYEVLREQGDRAERAGRTTLWPVPSAEDMMRQTGIDDYSDKNLIDEHGKSTKKTENKYKKVIAKAVNEELKKDGVKIFNYNTNQYINFSVSHLRKNVFDVLEEVLGPETANGVLGHSAGKDMGMSHYKVTRAGRKSGFSSALDEFVHLYTKDIGIANPQNWLKSLGFKKAADNIPNFIPETEFGRIQNQAEAVQSEAKTGAIQLSKEAEKAAEGIEQAATRAEAGVERLKTASEQMEALTAGPKTKRIDQLSNQEKSDLIDQNKLFGETDEDVEFRLYKERGEDIPDMLRRRMENQKITDRDAKVTMQNRMSGVVRPKGYVSPLERKTTTLTPKEPVTQQMDDLVLTEDQIVSPDKTEDQKISDMLADLRERDRTKEPLPEFLQEGPKQDKPKRGILSRLGRFGKKLPVVGGFIGPAYYASEAMAEKSFRDDYADQLSISELDESIAREQQDLLQIAEESPFNPMFLTTGDVEDVQEEMDINEEFKQTPEFKEFIEKNSNLKPRQLSRKLANNEKLNNLREDIAQRYFPRQPKDLVGFAQER